MSKTFRHPFTEQTWQHLQNDTRRRQQRTALQVFLFLGVLILVPSAVVDCWLFSQPVLARVELFFGVLSLIVLVLLRKGYELSRYAAYVFVALTGLVLWIITLMLETDMSTLLWIGIFPFIAFYLLGLRHGLVAHALFGLTIITTLVSGLYRLPYEITTQVTVNLTGILIAFGVFAYLYEYTNEQANRRWIRHSYTDPLTGLGNRQLFSLLLHKSHAQATRHHRSVSLILIDLDRFKTVNDTYGHVVGDHVLVELATLLSRSIRRSDTLIRWGGEEFIIIAPDTDIEHAHELAEKLRRTIQSHAFDTVGHITASFGVTQIKTEETEENAVRRADEALYRAKENGRNRIESA
jgi:diguanylate cyclase (GGDEF)-like protein